MSSRYFSLPRAAGWVEDDNFSPEPRNIYELNVPEHVSSYTGLLDQNGDRIMRSPNPMGFGKDVEWR